MSAERWSRGHRSKLVSGALAFVLLGLLLVFRHPLAEWFSPRPHGAGPSPQTALDAHVDHYTCSMHPSIEQAGPGKCPICGMDLVPVSTDEAKQGIVRIDDARRQLSGVRTAEVALLPMRSTLRAAGRVTYDETSISDVTSKVSGFVRKLLVNQTGQRVRRGQPLLSFYSPEVYNAERDFVLALQSGSGLGSPSELGRGQGASLAAAARKRLSLLGVGDAQIDAIAAHGDASESVTLASPASGFVVEKDVVDGSALQVGMRLYRIAGLDKVWVDVDVYEADLGRVRAGQLAQVTVDSMPGHTHEAKVAYVYPYLESSARTGRIRVELENQKRSLKPGMFANVEVALESGERLQVPSSAVVFTGPRRLVFVDLGEGQFRPQEVRVGGESSEMYEVLGGLKAGDRVAVAGVFLIAAEARIRGASK